jgi:hypothetical protein
MISEKRRAYNKEWAKNNVERLRILNRGYYLKRRILHPRPISARKKAQLSNQVRYWTGNACPRGHLADRYTCNGKCVTCSYDDGMSGYRKDPKKNIAIVMRSRSRPEVKERYQATIKEWRKSNPGRLAAHVALAVAKRKLRHVSWADKGLIAEFYERAADISRVTGIEHEVDHIEPMLGKHVSGLHNEFNLQILTMDANLRKGNRPSA